MSDTVAPSYDYANDGTLNGVIDTAIKQAMRNLEVMLPATVVAYDRVNNVASVQPSIMVVGTDGSLLARSPLASVPVLALGGGGFVINFPQTAGARGWIKASDRDISLYLQAGNGAAPNTARLHSFSDGMFIPDVMGAYTVSGEDSANVVLQNLAGTYRLAVWADRVKITSPGGTTEHLVDRVRVTTPRFDVASAEINFASTPNVGAIPP